MEYNIYCDESCHLQKDKSPLMALGAIMYPKEKSREINDNIIEIKRKYGYGHTRELKWEKISSSAYNCYEDLINYFFNNKDLNFRILIVDNKNDFSKKESYDEWYYKMYFRTLDILIQNSNKYNIYLDIKDSHSKQRVKKLKEVLANSNYDFSRSIINKVQIVRSEEIETMQILDILLGACSYYLRGLNKVTAKNDLIKLIQTKSGYSLEKNTPILEPKFNIFHLKLEVK